MSEGFDAKRAAALIEGRRIVELEVEIDRLTEMVVGHVERRGRALEDADTDLQVCSLFGDGELAWELRNAGFDVWADRLEARERARLSLMPTDIAVDLLMGRAVGCYFGQAPTQARMLFSDDILRAFTDAWETFSPAIADAVVGNPPFQELLINFLQEQVNAFTAAPRRMASIFSTNTCAMVEDFSERRQLSYVWRQIPYLGVFTVKHWMAFDALRRVNPTVFLSLLVDRI